jgi:23S rRNA pseudouridine2605 synthase
VQERLQKVLARAGIASRRKAELLIAAGRVQVNNRTVTEMGLKVEPRRDLVRVDGKLIAEPESHVYYLLYKPAGVVTTLSDPQGRPTVKDHLGGLHERVFPVGRLDYDAEGALVITNDGELAQALTRKRSGARRTYLAKVHGVPDDKVIERLRKGVRIEGGYARPREVHLFERAEKNTWLRFVIGEGKPHMVKRMCEAVGHPVQRLFRAEFAGLSVGGMRPGERRPITGQELKALLETAEGKERAAPPVELPPRRHGR